MQEKEYNERQMDQVFNNDFGKILYDPCSNMYEIHWSDSTEELGDKEFQDFLLRFADIIADKGTECFFVDATHKLFVMSNDIQEWHDKVIIPKYIRAGIKKIAFHVANNLSLIDISLELAFDEENGQKLQTRFFGSAEGAKEWLLLRTVPAQG